MRFRVFCHIQQFFPSSLVHQGLFIVSPQCAAFSCQHRGSGASGPHPSMGSPMSPHAVPGAHISTNTVINQRTTRETAAVQTALPDARSRYDTSSRACRMPACGRCDRDPEGMKVPQAVGMGAQVTPSTPPGLEDPVPCKHLQHKHLQWGQETAKPAKPCLH